MGDGRGDVGASRRLIIAPSITAAGGVAHQQFAVERAIESEPIQQVGEGCTDIFAGTGDRCRWLDSDTAGTRIPSHFHSAR